MPPVNALAHPSRCGGCLPQPLPGPAGGSAPGDWSANGPGLHQPRQALDLACGAPPQGDPGRR